MEERSKGRAPLQERFPTFLTCEPQADLWRLLTEAFWLCQKKRKCHIDIMFSTLFSAIKGLTCTLLITVSRFAVFFCNGTWLENQRHHFVFFSMKKLLIFDQICVRPSLLGKATDDVSADDLTRVVHSCRVLPFILVTSHSFCQSSDPSLWTFRRVNFCQRYVTMW